jgi:hypothetical protein
MQLYTFRSLRGRLGKTWDLGSLIQDYILENVFIKLDATSLEYSTGADGGHHSRVCSHLTLRSAPLLADVSGGGGGGGGGLPLFSSPKILILL